MSSDTCGCEGTNLERVRYFPRQLITADDMVLEQDYFRHKLRCHNRFLHGWGVVCGCEVKPPADQDPPWQVTVCPGYVITPQGDEILIGQSKFDIALGVRQPSDPCAPLLPVPPVSATASQKVYLAVRYMECELRPVLVHPTGCACDETTCEYSRIRDDFELKVLMKLPDSYEMANRADEEWIKEFTSWVNGNRKGSQPVPSFPKCTDDPWVVLACIELPDSKEKPITKITYEERRVIYSPEVMNILIRNMLQPSTTKNRRT
jgi:hypothetical protein